MRLLPVAIVVFVAPAWLAVPSMDADSSKIAFPANYKSWVLYNVIDREDQKEVHEQYSSREAIDAAKAGVALRYGTIVVSANRKAQLDAQGNPLRDARGNLVAGELDRLAVMEKRRGWGAEYSNDLRNGEWEFALFTPDGRINPQVPPRLCMACHKPHERLDYIKTYFAMAGKRVESTPAPIPAGASVATIMRLAVNPNHITVQPGTPVTWINADEVAHQFAVGKSGVKTDYFLKGGAGTVILKEPGIYFYEDTFYPNLDSLKGVIEVKK